MNPIPALVQRLLRNPHTSVVGLLWAVLRVLGIWLPQYKDKLDLTETFVVSYGFLMAGDANAVAPTATMTPSQNESEDPKPTITKTTTV